MDIDYLIVATDFTNYASTAARWAHHMREKLGAEVIVCHVVEVTVVNWFTNATETLDDEELHQRACKNLETWYRDVTGESPDRIELRVGSPHAQLADFVDELDGNSMTVAAMSGKSGGAKFFLGSTARMLTSRPNAPVVIVHPDHEYPIQGNPIVVGTDFSENAMGAIEFAIELGEVVQSAISIVHANPAPRVTVFDGGEIPIGLLQESANTWSRHRMETLEENLSAREGLDYETSIVQNEPAEAIREHAERNSADFVILAHSGESHLAQTVLGSVAQRVLNRMPTTLVIVPGRR